MLTTGKPILEAARSGHYAVAQINLNNLEWCKAALLTAEREQAPLILGVTEAAVNYMGGFRTVAGMAIGMHEDLNITVPIALQLDHAGYEACLQAMDAGFTAVMYDGSAKAWEENLEQTAALAAICRRRNVSLEAEVGSIAGEEDGVVGTGELASPEQCEAISACGITCLAAGIGNVHGSYPADWRGLSFETLEAIKAKTDLPLVLHGGSGIPEDMMREAIRRGICKVNVNTECQQAFAAAIRTWVHSAEGQEAKSDRLPRFLAPGVAAIEQVIAGKIRLFGSAGRAFG